MKIKIIKSENGANYDEYQKSIMYKCGNHAFIFLMLLVFVNALVKTIIGQQWAMPMIESMSLIYLALVYYLTSIFIKGAYVPYKNADTLLKGGIVMLLATCAQFALMFSAYSQRGIAGFYKNGALQDFSLLAISVLFMLYLAILMLIAWSKNKRELQSDDED